MTETQSVEQKFQGFLDCAQRGEVSYDLVYGAGVKMGIPEAEVERRIKISADKRRKGIIEDDDAAGGMSIKEIVLENNC